MLSTLLRTKSRFNEVLYYVIRQALSIAILLFALCLPAKQLLFPTLLPLGL